MGELVTDLLLTGLVAVYVTAVVIAFWKAFTDE